MSLALYPSRVRSNDLLGRTTAIGGAQGLRIAQHWLSSCCLGEATGLKFHLAGRECARHFPNRSHVVRLLFSAALDAMNHDRAKSGRSRAIVNCDAWKHDLVKGQSDG